MSEDVVDVAVIGGSYAGLEAALVLGRARLRVVVIDGGRPRNAAAVRVASYLGLAGATPDELLSAGRSALSAHEVTLETGDVLELHGHDAASAGLFSLSDGARREWRARAVLLATGLRDELPSVPGVEDLWGGDVVGCPHCHGWEVRDEALALVGFRDCPKLGVARALLVREWSEDVVLCTDGVELSADDRARLKGRGIRVLSRPVARLDHDESRLRSVVFDDGAELPRRGVFVPFRQRQHTGIAAGAGCATVASGVAADAIATDLTGVTSVPGIWAAGTTTNPALLAIGSAGHGSFVATQLHASLMGR